ncbi:S49 family peptidase [Flavobacterium sediminilitoris]|uniref:S49 family peptidase n=1 Tax=Flavobacterium sediminilitoris TaxID=2024526 RepID=A0ABY4HIL9_9FLAO|nr:MULTISPECIES: S49 family peptidase [Flavobacterium]UOX32408.1 S49 family peptidase [Flavobacterium sediminilitoris]
MNSNLVSLLNSPWMITDLGASSLMPNLLSIVKGTKIEAIENKIPVVFNSIDDDSYYEDLPESSSNSQYISVLSIKQPLFKYDQMCGPIGTRTMMRVLKEWESNDSIIGVVFDIDCPGGQVSGLAEFCEFIFNYSKPTVSFTDGTQASASEYVASACNYKIAHKYAEYLGSIGTMLKYVDLDGILKNEGAVIEDIYATGSSRKNEEHRKKQNENSNELIIQNILNPAREQFVSDIKKFRKSIDETLFEGQIVRPEEALSKGLIDEIGTMQTAFDKVVELSKAKKPSNNLNSNSNMNQKSLPKVEAVLGLDAPLALSENGSYLNTEQLDTIENRLDALETENSTLQTTVANATTEKDTAVKAVTDQLTEATNNAAAFETSVDAVLTNLGMEVKGTITEKLTALNTKTQVLGKGDGANHTNVKADGNATPTLDYVDATASHNQIANSIK